MTLRGYYKTTLHVTISMFSYHRYSNPVLNKEQDCELTICLATKRRPGQSSAEMWEVLFFASVCTAPYYDREPVCKHRLASATYSDSNVLPSHHFINHFDINAAVVCYSKSENYVPKNCRNVFEMCYYSTSGGGRTLAERLQTGWKR